MDMRPLIDRVWSLPNLVHFDLHEFSFKHQLSSFPLPSVVSSSLRHVAISGYFFEHGMLVQPFGNTPELQSLSLHVMFTDNDHFRFSIPLPNLNKLQISVQERLFPVRFFSLLQNTPNLRYLDVELLSTLVDGHGWQRLIHAYLPKLQTLKFAMDSFLAFMAEEDLESVFDTFRTPFWTLERRWFVRGELRVTFQLLNTFDLLTRRTVQRKLARN